MNKGEIVNAALRELAKVMERADVEDLRPRVVDHLDRFNATMKGKPIERVKLIAEATAEALNLRALSTMAAKDSISPEMGLKHVPHVREMLNEFAGTDIIASITIATMAKAL